METVNNRRGFIRGLGLFSAFVAGAAGHNALANSSVVDVPQTVDKSLAPPDRAMTVQLTGSYGDANVPLELTPRGSGSIYYLNPSNVVTNKVDMAVGRDDRLWIKVGDEWRRVAVES